MPPPSSLARNLPPPSSLARNLPPHQALQETCLPHKGASTENFYAQRILAVKKGRGRVVRVNLLTKENLWQKYFFSNKAEWSSKKFVKNHICWCKSWCKTKRNKRNGSYILKYFYEVPAKLAIKCKTGVYFYLIFGYFIHKIC